MSESAPRRQLRYSVVFPVKFAVNVCKLLKIECDIANRKPTQGVDIEFRAFTTMFGEQLRIALALGERMVRSVCTAPHPKALQPVLLLEGTEEATEATQLFDFLGMDSAACVAAFSPIV